MSNRLRLGKTPQRNGSPPKLVIHLRYDVDGEPFHEVFEGEVNMEDDPYKQLLGDEKATISVGRELSHSDYGNGGKVFVSVSINVDQSQAGITSGEAWARHFVDTKIWEHFKDLKMRLKDAGIVK